MVAVVDILSLRVLVQRCLIYITSSRSGGFSNTRSVLVMILGLSFLVLSLLLHSSPSPVVPPVLLTLHQRKSGQQLQDTSSVFGEILSSPLNPLTPRVNRTRDRAASNPSGHRERERRGCAKPSGILCRSDALGFKGCGMMGLVRKPAETHRQNNTLQSLKCSCGQQLRVQWAFLKRRTELAVRRLQANAFKRISTFSPQFKGLLFFN